MRLRCCLSSANLQFLWNDLWEMKVFGVCFCILEDFISRRKIVINNVKVYINFSTGIIFIILLSFFSTFVKKKLSSIGIRTRNSRFMPWHAIIELLEGPASSERSSSIKMTKHSRFWTSLIFKHFLSSLITIWIPFIGWTRYIIVFRRVGYLIIFRLFYIFFNTFFLIYSINTLNVLYIYKLQKYRKANRNKPLVCYLSPWGL